MLQWPGKWRLVKASVQGVSHIKNDVSCQDNSAYDLHRDQSPDHILIAAVADGAGSASFASDGSHIASQGSVLKASGHFYAEWHDSPEKYLKESLRYALELITIGTENENVDIREYATTLLLLVAAPDFIAVAQVGDGAVVVGDADGKIFALTKPQNGEHANETVFLTSPDAVENAEIVIWRGKVKHLAVFTDGLQRLALQMPEGTAHAPFFKPLFAFVENMTDADKARQELESFLYSPRIAERTDDDLTLLLACLSDS